MSFERLGQKPVNDQSITPITNESIYKQTEGRLSNSSKKVATLRNSIKLSGNQFIGKIKSITNDFISKVSFSIENKLNSLATKAERFSFLHCSKASKTIIKTSLTTLNQNDNELSLLETTLNLKNCPSPNLKKVYEDKQKFMREQMGSLEPKFLKEIVGQCRRFPLMLSAIKELANSYEKWDTLKKKDLGSLKEMIATQHKNLEELSKIISELLSYDVHNEKNALKGHKTNKTGTEDENIEIAENENVIKGLALNELTGKWAKVKSMEPENKFIEELGSFIKGHQSLKGQDIENVKNQFKSLITSSTLSKSKEKRPALPITANSLLMQARLFEASRAAQAAVLEKKGLPEARGDSVNKVYQLETSKTKTEASKNPNVETTHFQKGETAAFFKTGGMGESATGDIETLFYDMSLIFGAGVEEMFTPTKTTTMFSQETKLKSEETTKVFSTEGKLVNAYAGVSGGIQLAQKGKTLGALLEDSSQKPPVSQEQLIKGTLVTNVFGMFDAHPNNILVDDQGNLKFFDNTRSMPNSNGLINWSGLILPSYRSGLLALDGNYQSFTAEDRQLIQKELSNYQSKMEKMEKFLENKITQGRLGKLPKGWFNEHEALSAMKDRLKNMQAAFDNPNVKNLRDFVFATQPEFKFAAALTVYNKLKTKWDKPDAEVSLTQQKECLVHVGQDTLTQLLLDAEFGKVNPEQIKKWCEDPHLSFDDVISNMLTEFKSHNEEEYFQSECQRLKKEICSKAKIEVKDIDGRYIAEATIVSIDRVFQDDVLDTNADNIMINLQSQAKGAFQIHRDRSGGEPDKLTLYYKDSKDIKTLSLDYTTRPGMIKLENSDQFIEPFELENKVLNLVA